MTQSAVKLTDILKAYGILIAFVMVVIIMSILSPAFMTWFNILNVVRQSSIIGVMAIGVTFVILTGGIDLSVGSVLSVAGMFAAGILQNGGNMFVAVIVGLLVGIFCGLINGVLITFGRITPFVVTLGMMSIARGITLIYSNGYPISGFEPSFRFIGGGSVLGLPFPIILFLFSVGFAWFVLRYTRLGRYTYAIGGNEETVNLSGINVRFYKTMVYMISGGMAGVSALILTSRLNSALPTAGLSYELDVIASVVIGGTSLSGGRGSVWGTLIGALLIAIINNGMNLLGISPYFQQLVKGIIIISAVLIDRLREQ